jgi:hypothetical protein
MVPWYFPNLQLQVISPTTYNSGQVRDDLQRVGIENSVASQGAASEEARMDYWTALLCR